MDKVSDRDRAIPPKRDGATDVSYVIPVYNEEEALGPLAEAMAGVIDRLEPELRVEVLLVDDGSSDSSWRQIEALAEGDGHFAGVRLARNFGHQAALTCGYHLARGRAVICLDADLQDPPEVTVEMIDAWRAGADIVYGVRSSRAGESWFKLATASLFYWLLERLAAPSVPRNCGDFRLLSRRALDALNRMPERHRYLRGMVGWIGLETATVEYQRQPRVAGRTKFPFWKMMRFATDGIVSMSSTPLSLAYVMAAAAAVPFLLYLLYNVLLWWLWDVEMVPGWSSLILSITAFGSAILFFLGLLGEYVGRIYEEIKRRPLYLVRERTGGEASGDG